MTFAVVLPMLSVVPAWVLIAGVVIAAGLTPLATWAVSALRSRMVRLFLVAVAFAIVISLTLGVGTSYAAIKGCDTCTEWWCVIFWLC